MPDPFELSMPTSVFAATAPAVETATVPVFLIQTEKFFR